MTYQWGSGIKSIHNNRNSHGTYAARPLLTARGALQRFKRMGTKFLCNQCGLLGDVIGISNHFVEGPNSVSYEVTLACNHSRNSTLAVKRAVAKQATQAQEQ